MAYRKTMGLPSELELAEAKAVRLAIDPIQCTSRCMVGPSTSLVRFGVDTSEPSTCLDLHTASTEELTDS